MVGKQVPFLGWSRAAHEFRERVAADSAEHSSVLFIGPPGVGKKTMAYFWWISSGRPERELRILDLDDMDREEIARASKAGFPAVTTRPFPEELPYIFLGGRNKLGVPRAVTLKRKIGAEQLKSRPLPPAEASCFSTVLYMPYLRDRPIDILAILHYFNESGKLGRRFEDISFLPLLFSTEWPANATQLRTVLERSAQHSEGSTLDLHWELLEYKDKARYDFFRSGGYDFSGRNAPFDQLRNIAIHYLHAHLHWFTRLCVAEARRLRSKSGRSLEVFEAEIPDLLDAEKMLQLKDFQGRNLYHHIRQLKSGWMDIWGEPERRITLVPKSARLLPLEDATIGLTALQDGLTVTPQDVPNIPDLKGLAQRNWASVTGDLREVQGTAEGRDRRPAAACPYSFRLVGTVYELRFADEYGSFPQSKGLDLIQQLLRRPNPPLPKSALEIEGAPKGAEQTYTTRLGSKGMQAALDKWRALEDERTQEAVDQRDALEKIIRDAVKNPGDFPFNTKKPSLKPLSASSESKAKERIRKNIGNACAQLREKMPKLVRHVERFITPGDTFAYRPSPSIPWQLD